MQHDTAQITAGNAIPKSTNGTQTVERKKPARSLSPAVAEQCAYRWLYVGQTTRQISNGLRIHDRPLVENAIRDRLRGGPIVAPGLRSVA
jgi:hypothetical protein